jgi:hypothetical protein
MTGGELSRRRFLQRLTSAGAGVATGPTLARVTLPALGAATVGLSAACSRPTEPPQVVSLFSSDRVIAAGREQRIPFGVVVPDPDSADAVALPPDDGTLDVSISGADGSVIAETFVGGHVVEHDHVGDVDPDHQHANLFRYYPLRATLPEPGVYDVTVRFGGGLDVVLPVQAFDPDDVLVPLPGQTIDVPVTPTVDDPAGVDRLCTRPEQCPFHTVSAHQATAEGRPLALLVATPAFCQTAYCGPVVDTMIAAAANHPGVAYVHAEVYANVAELEGNLADPALQIAPAVTSLGLTFEPALFLIDGDGVLVDRLDNVFDADELDSSLALL